MSDDPYVDPTPVYISVAVCRYWSEGPEAVSTAVTLHGRANPCGHVDLDTAIQTFKCFVEDAFKDRKVSVRTCQFCGGDI